MCSGITNINMWLQCKENFLRRVAEPSVSGVSCSVRLAVFVKRKVAVNDQSLEAKVNEIRATFVLGARNWTRRAA